MGSGGPSSRDFAFRYVLLARNLFSLNFRQDFGCGSGLARIWLGCGLVVARIWLGLVFGCDRKCLAEVKGKRFPAELLPPPLALPSNLTPASLEIQPWFGHHSCCLQTVWFCRPPTSVRLETGSMITYGWVLVMNNFLRQFCLLCSVSFCQLLACCVLKLGLVVLVTQDYRTPVSYSLYKLVPSDTKASRR